VQTSNITTRFFCESILDPLTSTEGGIKGRGISIFIHIMPILITSPNNATYNTQTIDECIHVLRVLHQALSETAGNIDAAYVTAWIAQDAPPEDTHIWRGWTLRELSATELLQYWMQHHSMPVGGHRKMQHAPLHYKDNRNAFAEQVLAGKIPLPITRPPGYPRKDWDILLQQTAG